MLRSAFIVALALLPVLSAKATGQRTDRAQSSEAVTVAAKIGGKRYEASGPGSCRHAPEASIRGVSASLWTVQFDNRREGGVKQLRLTLWRLKDGGPDQLTFSLETKAGSYRITTGGEGEDAGKASVTVLPNGPGRRLEITGKESGGKAIQVTIDCPSVEEIEPEGG
jgi:hypothetical protein